MASITIKTTPSNGRYLQLEVTETSVNYRNNTSLVTWVLRSISTFGPEDHQDVSAISVKINGTEVYHKGYSGASVTGFPCTSGYTHGEVTINHNSNGKKTITCVLEGEVGSWVATVRQKDLALTNIDRTAPTVSFIINSYTDTTVTFTTTVSASCDLWQVSFNGGSWITFSSTNTSNALTYTATLLVPNTQYTIKVRARKYSNYVYGTTEAATFTTYGGSVINSLNTVTADASTVSIVYSATVYNNDVTHSFELKNGDTTILTFSNVNVVSGSNTITLTSSQRTTLLNAMTTVKSFTGTFILRTYAGSTEIGSGSSFNATVQTTAANSAPTFSGFTYADSNATTVGVTGDDQILIQNKSSLQITASAATAKNGASISSYSVSAGSVSTSSSSTSINVGLIPNTGTVPVTVTAIDSRGYSKSVTVNVTVLAYEPIGFTSYYARRENSVEATIQLYVEGPITSLQVNGVEKNTLTNLRYRYRETSVETWSIWYDITSGASVSSSGYTYNNAYLTTLDADKSWYIDVEAYDRLSGNYFIYTVPQGIPLISYRAKKVGINTREPRAGLDVVGGIISDGAVFEGQVKTSFHESVAMGSYQAQSTNIPDIVQELRYSSGCCGSASIATAYSLTGDTIETGWYNFLWIPHRSGGMNGQADSDNTDYGSCILTGMTGSFGTHILRFSGSTIVELRRVTTNAVAKTDVTSLQSGSPYASYGGCYYEVCGNIVHIHIGVSGITAGGTTGTTVFTMPEGLRPSTEHVSTGIGADRSKISNIFVNSTGAVSIYSQSTSAMCDIKYFI